MLTPKQIAFLRGENNRWLTATQLKDKGLIKIRASHRDKNGRKFADYEITDEGQRVLMQLEDMN